MVTPIPTPPDYYGTLPSYMKVVVDVISSIRIAAPDHVDFQKGLARLVYEFLYVAPTNKSLPGA